MRQEGLGNPLPCRKYDILLEDFCTLSNIALMSCVRSAVFNRTPAATDYAL